MFSPKNVIILLIITTGIVVASFLTLKSNTKTGTLNPTPTESPDIGTIQSEVSESETKETSEVRSPDGKLELIMEMIKDGDNTSYTFSVSETAQNTKKEIYSKTILAGTRFEMSPNAWSPDNKYFFVTEKGTNSVDYLVFRANGESFSEDEQYIDIAPLFAAKDTGFELSDVTGWASPILLYLLTRDSGERGPTYWLEIPSLAIIRLADR